MMENSGIYKIQSKIKPDRIYIGSAINISHRWSEHLWQLSKNKHHSIKLQRHYNKYGKNDLMFSILICCDKEDLIITEQFYLDSHKTYFNNYRTADSPLGYKHTEKAKKKMRDYNKRIGIKPPSPLGRKLSDETKKKLKEVQMRRWSNPEAHIKASEILKKRIISEQTRRKHSENKKGKPSWNKGIPNSEEAKEKMKIAWTNRKLKKIA